jgi:2-polyprenyl-6-methoxyphenol hydroxylase-like FAD-dependent oxidoreductase
LALALQAHDHGARVRIVERRTDLFRPSRALIVHPRTLEVLRPLGVTETLLDCGEVSPSVRLHVGGREIPVQLSGFEMSDTPYPHLLFVRQAVVEAVLSQALADRSLEVERGIEVIDLHHHADGAEATLRRAGMSEGASCRYVAGCDGPASTMRRLAGVGWRGGSYAQEIVLADLELEADLASEAHVVTGRDGLLFVFAPGEGATWRLLATRSRRGAADHSDAPGGAVSIDELQGLLDRAGLQAHVDDVTWSSRVHLEHRIASQYRHGSLFLVGDAAHVHSPAGGQGMNTGIQDALNLGWKLAFAATDTPDPTTAEVLLETYDRERRPVARKVLAMTHALFWGEAGTDPVARFARGPLASLASPVIPHLLRYRPLVAAVVRHLSQLRVHYRHSEISVDGTPRSHGRPRPGERLLDSLVELAGGRTTHLHELLAHAGIDMLLDRDASRPPEVAAHRLLGTHRILNWPGTGVCVVRPDGYVGFRCADFEPRQVAAWLALVAAPAGVHEAVTPRVEPAEADQA